MRSSIKPRWFRRVLSLGGAISLPIFILQPPPARGQADGEEVTKLRAFIVEASQDDPWRYAATPGYEILSRCPDPFTEAYVRALQRNAAAEATLLSEDLWGPARNPIKIILYNRSAPADAHYLSPVNMKWAEVNGAEWGSLSVLRSVPVEAGDGETFIACGNYWNLLHRRDPPVAGSDDIRRQRSMLDSDEAGEPGSGLGWGSGFSIDPDSDIRLANHTPELPAWFKVGLKGPCGIVRGYLVREKWNGRPVLILPALLWARPEEASAMRSNSSHSPRLLPLADFFSGRGAGQDEDLWEAEAALFDRWGLFASESDRNDFRAAFLAFVRRATGEPVTEQMFRDCFGLGYAEAERRLRSYLPGASKDYITVPMDSLPTSPVSIRFASPGEIGRILGDWLRFEGYSLKFFNPDLSRQYLDRAARLYERTYGGGERTPPFLAAMGLYALKSGDSRARALLEGATQGRVIRARAYLELARLRFEDALPGSRTGVGDLTPAEFSAILNPLFVAREQMPSLIAGYELMVEVLEHAPAMPSRDDLAFLADALRLFPRHADLVRAAARLYERSHFYNEAAAMIERGKKFADTDEARAILAQAGIEPAK